MINPFEQYRNRPALIEAAVYAYLVYVTTPIWGPMLVLRFLLD